MGLNAKLQYLYIWWHHRPLSPKGPLPKNEHSRIVLIQTYPRGELGFHTKNNQNRTRNNKVMAIFFLRRYFAKDLSEKTNCTKPSKMQYLLMDIVVFELNCIILSLCCSYEDCLWQLWLKQTLFSYTMSTYACKKCRDSMGTIKLSNNTNCTKLTFILFQEH